MSSRCSRQTYLLKGYSNLNTLKDTYSAPLPRKFKIEPSCPNKRKRGMQHLYKQVLLLFTWGKAWSIFKIKAGRITEITGISHRDTES